MSSRKQSGAESQVRHRSAGDIEGNNPRGGRRSTIAAADLNNADRALAEQFGYNPVSSSQRNHHTYPCAIHLDDSNGTSLVCRSSSANSAISQASPSLLALVGSSRLSQPPLYTP